MTDHNNGEADVFAIPDFWPTSKCLDELPYNDDVPFFSSKLYDAINSPFQSLSQIKDVATDQHGFFKLPQLDSEAEEVSSNNEAAEKSDLSAPSVQENEIDSDVWLSSGSFTTKTATLRTWEGFLQRKPEGETPIFITEAGSAAYDALLSNKEDYLRLGNADVPMIQPRAYTASLLALALGRESVFFQKRADRPSFSPILPKMRVPGYSADILKGPEAQCLACGESTLKLRQFVQEIYKKHSSRCCVALASVIDEVLRAAQENIIVRRESPRSLLQLQSIVRDLSSILDPFDKLISQLSHRSHDEQVVSRVFDYACAVNNDEQWTQGLIQETLRKVSRPWLEFLEEWIGTRAEEGISLRKSMVGKEKGFVKVEAETYTDDAGQEVEEIDFRLKPERVPHFFPNDVVQTMFETGRNLRFIRSHHPSHPFSRSNFLSISRPPKTDWLYDWDAILRHETGVAEYRDRLLDAIEASREDSGQSSQSVGPVSSANTLSTDLFAVPGNCIEERFLASMERLNAPPPKNDDETPFYQIIHGRLAIEKQEPDCLPSTPHWSLLPILSFGTIISAQAQAINRETLRLLFENHDLRGHLKLQRDYHLMGNGTFSGRLSDALFDPELERADRQPGVARQGSTMGLRLGGRDTWPPASSELRLALMGVLSESYFAEHPSLAAKDSHSRSKDIPSLPGNLSFNVRDLAEEEIDICANPNSLEALDFLRLSYTAPSQLGFIITPVILIQYDKIFKRLLRLLRMTYVVNQLWRDVITQEYTFDDIYYRFVRESRNFVYTIKSHFMDNGVSSNWKLFDTKLDKIQAALRNRSDKRASEKLESPEQLREFHSDVLQRIMGALFLKRRQQPVLKLLEEIFSLILQFFLHMRAMLDNDSPSDIEEAANLYSDFKKKIQVFITVCRTLSEKSRAGPRQGDSMGLKGTGLGEDNKISQLLLRLDIGDFYIKPRT